MIHPTKNVPHLPCHLRKTLHPQVFPTSRDGVCRGIARRPPSPLRRLRPPFLSEGERRRCETPERPRLQFEVSNETNGESPKSFHNRNTKLPPKKISGLKLKFPYWSDHAASLCRTVEIFSRWTAYRVRKKRLEMNKTSSSHFCPGKS